MPAIMVVFMDEPTENQETNYIILYVSYYVNYFVTETMGVTNTCVVYL